MSRDHLWQTLFQPMLVQFQIQFFASNLVSPSLSLSLSLSHPCPCSPVVLSTLFVRQTVSFLLLTFYLQVPQRETFSFAPGEHGITDWVSADTDPSKCNSAPSSSLYPSSLFLILALLPPLPFFFSFFFFPSHSSSQQTDQLLISKMVESVSMATTSLISLVQLLDKVKNMVISDHIQREVRNISRLSFVCVFEVMSMYISLVVCTCRLSQPQSLFKRYIFFLV